MPAELKLTALKELTHEIECFLKIWLLTDFDSHCEAVYRNSMCLIVKKTSPSNCKEPLYIGNSWNREKLVFAVVYRSLMGKKIRNLIYKSKYR